MKLKFFFLFLLFTGSFQAQIIDVNAIKKDSMVNEFIVFDQVWYDLNTSKKYNTDNSPHFLQIENGYGIMHSLFRGLNVFIEGPLENYTVSIVDSVTITRFFIKGTNRALGNYANVEVYQYKNGKIEVHAGTSVVNNGQVEVRSNTAKINGKKEIRDVNFIGHIASAQEIEKIRLYYQSSVSTKN